MVFEDKVERKALNLSMPEQLDPLERLEDTFNRACQEVEIRKRLKYCKNPMERLMLERDLSFVTAHAGIHKGSKKKRRR